jgi:hypothetical protein
MSRLEAKFPIIGRAERVYSLAQAQDDPTLLIWDDKHFSSHGTEVDFTGGACRGELPGIPRPKRRALGWPQVTTAYLLTHPAPRFVHYPARANFLVSESDVHFGTKLG